MNADAFKQQLVDNQPLSLLVSTWLFERVPYIFGGDSGNYILWKEALAERLDVDSKAIIFTGSSGCGFSLNPTKNYKIFDNTSDVDLAIVSQHYFEIAWHTIRALKTYNLHSYQKESIQEHKQRLIYWGTIGTDKILELLPFGKKWILALSDAAKTAPIDGRKINIRIYKDYDALRAYQRSGFNKLRLELLSGENHSNERKLVPQHDA